MRLFMAIEPDERTRRRIEATMAALSAKHKARFVEPKNLHFTLKFLGEVEDTKLADVVKGIEKSLMEAKQFRLHVKGMGHFGSRKFARVIWVGTMEGKEDMSRLSAVLEKNLSQFKQGEHDFSPHLTVCRPRGDTSALVGDVDNLNSEEFGEFAVNETKLKKSTLTPEGPVYEDVRAFVIQ
jgi:2'-5' RNA ligase